MSRICCRKLVWHMDEPTADPAIITAYLVCRRPARNRPSCFRASEEMNCSRDIESTSRIIGRRLTVACPAARGVWLKLDFRAPAGYAGTAHERQFAAGKKNGAQRVAESHRTVHCELYLSRMREQKSELYAEDFAAIPQLIRPRITGKPSIASGMQTSCTRCSISTARSS